VTTGKNSVVTKVQGGTDPFLKLLNFGGKTTLAMEEDQL
jgi:hypothetical protein